MKPEVREILETLHKITKSPLTFFDLETTGLDKMEDEIVQIYLCKYDGKDFIENSSYYNTNVEIRKEAFEKHGLTKDFLSTYPYFGESAKEIYSDYFSKGTILCGFNSNQFDVPFIIEKFLQAKIPTAINILQNKRIDAFALYRELFPNNLESIYKRLVGKTLDGAHDAKNDITATIEILGAILKINENCTLVTTAETIDTDGFFKRDGNDIFFAKGKQKGSNILKMDSKEALGFLGWMTRTKSISIHSRTIAIKLIEKIEKSLIPNINL